MGTLRRLPRKEIRVFDAPVRFSAGGIEAWAAPDLVFRIPGGARVVVDWKTGKEEKDAEREQVSAYGLFLTSTAPWWRRQISRPGSSTSAPGRKRTTC